MKNIFNRPVVQGSLLYKVGVLFVLVLSVAVLTPVFSYLNVAFGWTNPSQNPPGGSGILTAYQGKLGINAPTPSTTLTVNGIISAMGHVISDVATPIDGKDAVNKDYVLAQVGGSGGASLITYGVGVSNTAGLYNLPGGALPQYCFRLYPSGALACSSVPGNATVDPGTNAPACPTGWTEAYAGYGPHGTLWTFYGDPSQYQKYTLDNETSVPGAAAAATYSICSASAYETIEDNYANNTGNNITSQGTYLSACSVIMQNGTKIGDKCNTCRVCVK